MELPTVSVKKIDDDILLNVYKKGVELSENDAMEIDNVHITMSQGKDVFIIADFSKGTSTYDDSAEKFFVNKGKMIPFTNAIAIISNPKKSSFLTKIFASNRTYYPVKEVDSIEEAKAWFETLRKEINTVL